MNIVIIGAGEVGFNLAKVLSREDYDITVVDSNPDKCNRAKAALDVKVMEGDGASQRLLQKIDMLDVDDKSIRFIPAGTICVIDDFDPVIISC